MIASCGSPLFAKSTIAAASLELRFRSRRCCLTATSTHAKQSRSR